MFGFREFDRVLRGEVPSGETKLAPLMRVLVLLAVSYGVCMGVYALSSREEPEFRQMLASALKVPALLVLTLLVTFPSLYVFNTLLGSRLHMVELARLLASAFGVLVAVLAAFGPIVAFFSVTTSSYPFILLLNVVVFAVAGSFGLGYLQRTLGALIQLDTARRMADATPPDGEPEMPTMLDGSPTRTVFTAWMFVFALVGSQMSWVLRPFIGSPDKAFTWFRPRDSSFLEAVGRSIRVLLAGG